MKTPLRRTKRKNLSDLEMKQYNREQVEDMINERQQQFCHHYIKFYNKTRSYKEVYGFHIKDNVAAVNASKMLKVPKVRRYVELIKEDIAKQVGISKIGLLTELKDLALSNVSEVYEDWITQESFDKLKKEKPEILKAIQEISTKVETKLNEDKELIQVNYVKIKFYDKQRAIEMIFKAMGWNEPDNINIFMEQPLFAGKLK
jgi:phage terminase small subunit